MIEWILIEVTRRCNMSCAHCMRGDPQDIDIKDDYLTKFFNGIKNYHIKHLTITGGEPSLVPEKIKKIFYLIKENKIKIDELHITTNGTGKRKFQNIVYKNSIGLFKTVSVRQSLDEFHTKVSITDDTPTYINYGKFGGTYKTRSSKKI